MVGNLHGCRTRNSRRAAHFGCAARFVLRCGGVGVFFVDFLVDAFGTAGGDDSGIVNLLRLW